MITMYTSTAPVLTKMLTNAKGWLDKANAHCTAKNIEPQELLEARLIADMFTFTKQIQTATDHAKACMARLAGVDLPSWPDDEKSFAELHARLDKAIAYVGTFKATQIDGTDEKDIVWSTARGERRFKGEDFVRWYAMPNFYFHCTTAYGILRHKGVEVGKADFLRLGT